MTVPVPPPPSPPAPPRARWPWALAAVLVVLIAVTVVAIVGLVAGGRETDVVADPPTEVTAPSTGPTPTTPTPTSAPATPAPTDEATGEPTDGPTGGLRPEGIDELAAQVEAVRGLPLVEDLRAEVLPASELGERFASEAIEEEDAAAIALDDRLLTTLRLLGPDHDLAGEIAALYGDQILGLYDMDEETLYVGGDSPALSPAQRVTAAHEIVHALQDQTFGLDRLNELDDLEADAQLAALALVEGDAVLTQERWSVAYQSPEERQEVLRESLAQSPDTLLAAPRYLRDSLVFPYQAGGRFVLHLFQTGGQDAVDAAFANPPTSTRQVLRPETYVAGERHRGIEVTATPGDGWQDASTYTFGEFDVDQWLVPIGPAREAVAAGWDGGMTRHWHRGDDDAVALALRFRTAEAAAAACDAAPTWYRAAAAGEERQPGVLEGDRDWMAYRCEQDALHVGLGPDAATATALTDD